MIWLLRYDTWNMFVYISCGYCRWLCWKRHDLNSLIISWVVSTVMLIFHIAIPIKGMPKVKMEIQHLNSVQTSSSSCDFKHPSRCGWFEAIPTGKKNNDHEWLLFERRRCPHFYNQQQNNSIRWMRDHLAPREKIIILRLKL